MKFDTKSALKYAKSIFASADDTLPQWQREGFECYDDYLALGGWEDEPEPEFISPTPTLKKSACSFSGHVIDETDVVKNRKAYQLSRLARTAIGSLDILVVGDILYGYNTETGAYRPLTYPDRDIAAVLPEEQIDQLSTRDLAEIVERIKRFPYRQQAADEFNAAPYLVNCKNGVLTLSAHRPKLCCNSPEHPFTYCVDARYIQFISDRYAPTFEDFCLTSLEGNEIKRQLLLEMLGYIISDSNGGKCALFFKGAPDSGKSVMADLVGRLFGCDNVANVPLHKLADRFNKAELFGKKVNICGEIKAQQLSDISTFKMFTGGDRIHAEFKGQNPFTFHPRCKLLFSGNALPGTREADSTAAFANRLVVLLFSRSIPKDEQDKLLGEKLWGERDSIFSMAIDAYQTLVDRNFIFTRPDDSVAFIRSFCYSENSIRAFIDDCCCPSVGSRIFNRDLLGLYTEFCRQNGLECRSRQQLYDAIDALPGVTACRFRMGTENHRGRIGIDVCPNGWNIGTTA